MKTLCGMGSSKKKSYIIKELRSLTSLMGNLKYRIALHAYLQRDVEGSLGLSQSGRNVDAVDIAVVALAEDHPVERPVEDDPDPHHVLLALHLQVLDLGHVGGLGDLPGVSAARGGGQTESTIWKIKHI